MVRPAEDAYGEELKSYLAKGHTTEIVERSDGYIDAHEGIPTYFSPFEEWNDLDRKAIEYVRGRTLDVGAGAGRVSRYLQSQRQECVAIDNSPGAVEVCRQQGVKDARVLPFTQVNSSVGLVDSIAMFGNNFGLFGSYRSARWLLRRLTSITTEHARIVGETTDPYDTDNPDHLQYHELNRKQGRMGGQLRIRVRHRRFVGPWFDYLFVSREELRELLEGTGWRLETTLDGPGPGYFAIICRD